MKEGGIMVYDAIIIVAQARLQDRYAEAVQRALIAEAKAATPTRNPVIVRIGHCLVGIGERIEGVRYAPVAPLSPHRSSR